jgi:hypothetical protein
MTGIDSNLPDLMAKGMTLEDAINYSVESVTISRAEWDEIQTLLMGLYQQVPELENHPYYYFAIEKLIKNELNP